MKNPLVKINLMVTPDSIEDLQAYCSNFSDPEERLVAHVVMGMTWNLASQVIEDSGMFEDDTQT